MNSFLLVLKGILWICAGIVILPFMMVDDYGFCLSATVRWLAGSSPVAGFLLGIPCLLVWIIAKFGILFIGVTCFIKAFKPRERFSVVLSELLDAVGQS